MATDSFLMMVTAISITTITYSLLAAEYQQRWQRYFLPALAQQAIAVRQ